MLKSELEKLLLRAVAEALEVEAPKEARRARADASRGDEARVAA